MPLTELDVASLPDGHVRALFDALRLEIHYDRATNTARCRTVIAGEALPSLVDATRQAAEGQGVPFCDVPPTGFEPVLPP